MRCPGDGPIVTSPRLAVGGGASTLIFAPAWPVHDKRAGAQSDVAAVARTPLLAWLRNLAADGSPRLTRRGFLVAGTAAAGALGARLDVLPAARPRIAIVGAGISGLTSALNAVGGRSDHLRSLGVCGVKTRSTT